MKSSTTILFLLSAVVSTTNGFSVVRLDSRVLSSALAGGSHNHKDPPVSTGTCCSSVKLSALREDELSVVDKHDKNRQLIPQWMSKVVVASSLMIGVSFSNLPLLDIPPALAEGSKVVGKLQGSGLVFKDTLQIERFEGKIIVCLFVCLFFQIHEGTMTILPKCSITHTTWDYVHLLLNSIACLLACL